jgi:hypothetical protein
VNGVRVADLDESALAVRSADSRVYILEAIQAYRGGAYRSSVISTWIAVVFDIIAKIRELASDGDAAAEQFTNKLDQEIQAKAITKLQQIESSILDEARDKFEFLSTTEYTDLARLKEDRNFCAHPAFVGEEILFQPTPELVRTHIVHAIKHLLQHPPVQGKSALKRIIDDMERLSFPDDVKSTAEYMDEKYLKRAKDALIRNLTIGLLKQLTRLERPGMSVERVLNVLKAISGQHPQIYESVTREKFSSLLAPLDDSQMTRVFSLIAVDPRAWDWLPNADQMRLKGAIKSCDPADGNVYAMIDILDLQAAVIEMVKLTSTETVVTVIQTGPSMKFVGVALWLFKSVTSYRESEFVVRAVLDLVPFLKAEHIVNILDSAKNNDQINYAGRMPNSLEKLFDQTTQHLALAKHAWCSFIEFVEQKYPDDDVFRYPGLRRKLEKIGAIPSL